MKTIEKNKVFKHLSTLRKIVNTDERIMRTVKTRREQRQSERKGVGV